MPPDRPADESERGDGRIEIQAVYTRDKNITKRKNERRRQQLEDRVARYLAQFDCQATSGSGPLATRGTGPVPPPLLSAVGLAVAVCSYWRSNRANPTHQA